MPKGFGGVTTTVAVRREADLRALFGIPDTVVAAALVVLGHPVAAPRRLKRAPSAPSPGSTATRVTPLGADPDATIGASAVVKWAMAQNVMGEDLKPCNYDPLTGFYRDGCCNTGAEDVGVHTVCTKVTAEFLTFSASVGNDLSTPHPEFGFAGLQPGDQWCLCAARWQEALRGRRRPAGGPRSTHAATLEWVQLSDLVAHAL